MTDTLCPVCGRRVGTEERAPIQQDRILHVACAPDLGPKTSPPINPQYLMIVQLGQTRLFREFHDRLQPLGHTQVVWDRRKGDRRVAIDVTPSECRRVDRRQIDLLGTLVALLLAVPVSERSPAAVSPVPTEAPVDRR
jgi:hypothetical protein